jgi:protease-4
MWSFQMQMKQAWIRTVLVAIVASLAITPAWAAEEDKIAIIKLKGPLTEAPDALDLSAFLGSEAPQNMYNLLKTLKQARTDKEVRAIIFDIEQAALGFAQIQDLRDQFKALKAADKDVLIYCETLTTGTLLLGSSASKLVLMPKGVVDFTGMYGEASYYKNLLDKIGVEADILHCGAFKSAGEPFYRTGPSKEADEQTNRLFDSIFEQIVLNIAESRKLEPEQVRELIDKGIFSAKEAKEAKLVDDLQYRGEFIKKLKRQYGDETKFVADYGKKKGPEVDMSNPFAFFKLFSDLMNERDESDKPAIAVVYVEGMIVGGEEEPSIFGGGGMAHSETIRKAILQAAREDNVKALILRVDSPGGSAIASEVICEATEQFKSSDRPFIVSMGNVAGSGGYYVSALADTIFAEPSTITGSIGVVGGKLVTKGLWDWCGITGHEYKRGKRADIMNGNRRFDEDERSVIMNYMTRTYEEFKDRVTQGRGKRIKGDLEPLAGGRVYTGKQALDVGLVDQLGSFADAIKHTASEAELGNKYELRIYPRPKTLGDILSEAFGGKEDTDETVSTRLTAQTLGSRFAKLPTIAGALEALRAVDPTKAASLEKFLIQLELLAGERVILVGPPVMTLNP